MSPDLSRRLARSLDVGLATAEERRRISEAAAPPRVRTFGDLPDEIRRLVRLLDVRA